MTIQFFLPFKKIPTVTNQEHRIGHRKNGKPYIYEDARLAETREVFKTYLAKYAPPAPITSGTRLVTKWIYPVTAGHKAGEYKTTSPDTDNVIKLFKDCMADVGFFKNDALVASETTEKFYGDITGIWVYVETLEKE